MQRHHNKTAPAFAARIANIESGKEAIDTMAKLKDLWLFAITQGWEDWTIREGIAREIVHINFFTVLTRLKKHLSLDKNLQGAFDDFNTYEVIGGPPEGSALNEKEYSDRLWRKLEVQINKIDVTKCDKLLAEHMRTKPKVPAAFLTRYNKIMNGEEKLDTITNLKNFLRFFLAHGDSQSYEVRAHMTEMILALPIDSTLFNSTPSIRAIYIELESFSVISSSIANDGERAHRQYGETGWRGLEFYINNRL